MICGKEFYSPTKNRKFCSPHCRLFNPDVTRKCKYCGKDFHPKFGHDKQQFCSLYCRNKAPKVKTIIRHCLNCGKEIVVYPHQISRGKGKYCSAKCQFLHCQKGTDIELIVKKYLDEHNIDYIFQYNLDDTFYPDFYLTKSKVILEVQGDYWHGNPRIYKEEDLDKRQLKHRWRDRRKFGYYKHKHIKYYELWGIDIKKDIDSTMKQVKEIA